MRGRGGLVENKDYNHSFDLGGHIVPLAFTSCLCHLNITALLLHGLCKSVACLVASADGLFTLENGTKTYQTNITSFINSPLRFHSRTNKDHFGKLPLEIPKPFPGSVQSSSIKQICPMVWLITHMRC